MSDDQNEMAGRIKNAQPRFKLSPFFGENTIRIQTTDCNLASQIRAIFDSQMVIRLFGGRYIVTKYGLNNAGDPSDHARNQQFSFELRRLVII